MYSTLRTSVSVASILISIVLTAQSNIEIDLNVVIEDQEITTSVAATDLPDLQLFLLNVNAADDADSFEFSGPMQEEGTINETINYDDVNNTIDFTFADIEDIAAGEYTYTITYSGDEANRGAVFGDENELTLTLTIVPDEPPVVVDSETYTDLEIQASAIDYVLTNYNPEKYFDEKRGIYLEKNTVHIFIDQNGNQIFTGIPTTAKETYLYQIHLLVAKNTLGTSSFKFSYAGKYVPKFNIQKTGKDIPGLNSDEVSDEEPVIEEISFAKIGPFTDNFTVKLEKSTVGRDGNTKKESLLNNKIEVAKLYHVSISTGLLASTLKNPQNIEKALLPNSTDSTLIADDPNTRGIFTITATFYPKGRSLLFTPSGGLFDPTRFGIQVGAQLNDNLSENFFFGFSHDFARGGSISYGAHYGRRNYVGGKDDFDFGSEVFDLPELIIKREWDVGFYFGVVVDSRVAIELFKSLGATN